MSNIKKAFENGKAFIPFITCGDPDLETTEKIVKEIFMFNRNRFLENKLVQRLYKKLVTMEIYKYNSHRDNLDYSIKCSKNTLL